MRSRLFVYLCLGMFTACTSKPVYVLSDKKMEDVLFDLYIVEAGMKEKLVVLHEDSAQKQDLLQSVFKKHKISQAKFDTSLVWYNANLKRYLKINDQVNGRFDQWINQLQTGIDRIKRAEERAKGNALRFEDIDFHDFDTPLLFFWSADTLFVLSDTIRHDTIMNDPEKTYRFERYCFYEEE